MLSHKGSYTIEAAVWVPLFLMVIMMALKVGMTLYSDIVEKEGNEKITNLEVVEEFYHYQILEEIIQEATDD